MHADNHKNSYRTVIRYSASALILLALFFLYLVINTSQNNTDDSTYCAVASGNISSATYPVEDNIEPSYNSDIEFTEVTYTFKNKELMHQHFKKHEDEFSYSTAEEYVVGANKVITSKEALSKTEAEDGDLIYYLEKTNEIVFLSKDGYIRTYFKPDDGIKYFNRQ